MGKKICSLSSVGTTFNFLQKKTEVIVYGRQSLVNTSQTLKIIIFSCYGVDPPIQVRLGMVPKLPP